MHASSLSQPSPAPRMGWLDANRVLAAVGVVLIHSTSNFSGDPFKTPDRLTNLGAALLRNLAELSGAEIFFVFSLFLLAHKLERRPMAYGAVIQHQARRLLLPFLAWTLFFAFFRLGKASAFGYTDAIWRALQDPSSWVKYLLLGSAQYHLHFIPTLFTLVLFYPCMRLARRYPALGLVLVPMLYVMDYAQRWAWGAVTDPFSREMLLQGMKNLGYIGYGMQAFAFHGYWKRGLDRDESRELSRMMLFFTGLAFLVTCIYAYSIALEGRWVDRNGGAFYAHLLLPVLIFGAFMGMQYVTWSPRFGQLATYTFGVYLVHPILIDLFDIAAYTGHWNLSPLVMILAKFCFAVPGAFGLAYVLGKIPPLAFLIGIEGKPEARSAPVRIVAAP